MKTAPHTPIPPLPESFVSQGWQHEQMYRKGNVAIYKRWKSTSFGPHFETVLIQVQKEREALGVVFQTKERYPTISEWGEKGWTYDTLEGAQAKSFELLDKQSTKHL